ncbi:cyclase family protein [uncultured Friedmanniella sp.]|uniref:cyclase family protein n=1 Tax=uncultured Friedmanniella sp. TaxID=335381 RepID=UPI0035C9FD42
MPPSDNKPRVVDLTLLLAEELPCWWSTHMPFQQKTFSYFDERGDAARHVVSRSGAYQTRWLLVDEHTGTHCDAPAHFFPEPETGLEGAAEIGRVTVEQLPLDQLMGPAVVIDVPPDLPGAGPGVSPIIGPELVTGFEAAHGPVEAGDVVLFRSGWDRHYVRGEGGSAYCYDPLVLRSAPGWPAPEPPVMRLLVERGVRCVGTDSPSMGSSHDGAPVHREGLGAGVVFVEALGRLDQLPPRGAFFVFAPLNLARGTGAPGRALAWLPTEEDSHDH